MHKTLIGALSGALLFATAAGAADQAAKPTDPQIAHIAYTAGQIDIEAAKQALDKSKNNDVRAFAQQMVGDHTTVNNQALALVKKLNVKPEDNPTSQSLTKQAEATEISSRAWMEPPSTRLTWTMRSPIIRRSIPR